MPLLTETNAKLTGSSGRLVMKLAFQPTALLLFVVLAMASIGARAGDDPSLRDRYEVALDIDHDGRMDRAVLVRHPSGPSADLLIFLAAGDEQLEPSRKPEISKKDIASGHVMRLTSKGRGSLVVQYGYGGCSNDTETTLTIVRRDGEFWVAGFSYGWETRDFGTGSCDINFLTGKGVRSQAFGKGKPIKARFTPVKLADWSVDKQPNACF